MGKVLSVEQKSKDFRENYPSGKMSLEDFKKEYAKLFPGGDTSDLAEYVFHTLDINADGEINFQEFMDAVKLSCTGTVENKLIWAFCMYDLAGNGYVSKCNMLLIIKAIYKSVGSGVEMLEDRASPETQTDRIFKQLDMNRDGKLSLNEFVEGAISDPTIAQILLACNPIDLS